MDDNITIREEAMKKWIGIVTALFLALGTATAFADHIQPVEPKQIKHKDAKKQFNEGMKKMKKDDFNAAVIHFQAAEKFDPNVPEFHIDTALAMAAQGQKIQAKNEFDLAANLIAQIGPTGTPPKG